LRSFLLIAILLCFAILPFELPIAEALHGILWHSIGNIYLLFICGTWVSVIASCFIVLNAHRMLQGWQQFVLYSALFIILGLLAVGSTAFTSPENLQLSFQQLIFGYTAPVLLGFTLFCMNNEERKRAWLAFYAGACLFLMGSLVLLFVSWRAAVSQSSFFAGLGIGQKLFAWRYTFGEPWNLYSIYIGNANKESNYLIMFLLFSTSLLGNRVHEKGRTRVVYIVFWALSIFTLLMLFSRAAILLLPVVIYVSGFWGTLRRAVKLTITAFIGFGAAISYASYSAVFAYLFTATYIDDVSAGVLGTFNDRFQQWKELATYLMEHQGKLFFGFGTGGYGLHFFNSVERGTHNMFLDSLAECGILGFAFLVVLVLWLLLDSLDFFLSRRVHAVAFIGIVALIALMFREHSVSYLYVTSLGGLCFVALFYLLACPGRLYKSAMVEQ